MQTSYAVDVGILGMNHYLIVGLVKSGNSLNLYFIDSVFMSQFNFYIPGSIYLACSKLALARQGVRTRFGVQDFVYYCVADRLLKFIRRINRFNDITLLNEFRS